MSKLQNLNNWLRKKFSIILLSSKTLEEKKRWNLNRFALLSLSSFVIIIIMAITVSVIVFTPLRYVVPGFTDKETQQISISNAIRLDSLEHEIKIRDQYINNMKQVLMGEKPFNPKLEMVKSLDDTSYQKMYFEKNLGNNQKQSGELKKNNTNSEEYKTPSKINFFPPVNGVITNSFDPVNNHFGTDIVSPDNEIVRSALHGTVILSNWTVETGYTIQIQHKNNYLSVYRHLKKTIVKTGEKVETGQPIGVYGNTGEISYGPHLHFELWHNGKALNPEKNTIF